MPMDSKLEMWLDEWEVRQRSNPALTPDEFLAGLCAVVPRRLIDCLRQAITELDLVAHLLKRMKDIDRTEGH